MFRLFDLGQHLYMEQNKKYQDLHLNLVTWFSFQLELSYVPS